LANRCRSWLLQPCAPTGAVERAFGFAHDEKSGVLLFCQLSVAAIFPITAGLHTSLPLNIAGH